MLLDFWWIKFFFYILVFKKLEWFKMKPVNKVASTHLAFEKLSSMIYLNPVGLTMIPFRARSRLMNNDPVLR